MIDFVIAINNQYKFEHPCCQLSFEENIASWLSASNLLGLADLYNSAILPAYVKALA